MHETIEDTHNCYNTNLKLLAENLGHKDRLFVGSHNLESVDIAKKLILKHNLNDGRFTFGQLKGFSD